MLSSLSVRENKIVDSNGKEVILKGSNINSPYMLIEEKHDFLQDIKEIKKLGFNAIRVPICPAYWQAKDDYLERILNPIVSLCKEIKLYCILDWHAQGNPVTGESREPKLFINGYLKYDAKKEIAEKALDLLAKRYGKEDHVLFEAFCSPIGPSWKEWREIAQKFVKIIRKYSSSIILINGVDWCQNLKDTLKYPINDRNIVYGMIIYNGTKKKDKKNVIKVKNKHPIIVVECGYQKNAKEEFLRGTKKKYAYELKKFLESNKLSWFAWCYHPTRQPIFLNSWNPDDLSEWGQFVKEELL